MSKTVSVSPDQLAADREFLKQHEADARRLGEKRIVRHSRQARWTHGITIIA